MKVNRLDESYAWAECASAHPARPTCKNTVKFGRDGSEGCCPACSTLYRCCGDSAERIGAMIHDDPDDDEDPGHPEYDGGGRPPYDAATATGMYDHD